MIVAPVEPYMRMLLAAANSQGPYGSVPNNAISTMEGVSLSTGALTATNIANNQTAACATIQISMEFFGGGVYQDIPGSQIGAAQSVAGPALTAINALSSANLSATGAALLASDIVLLKAYNTAVYNNVPSRADCY